MGRDSPFPAAATGFRAAARQYMPEAPAASTRRRGRRGLAAGCLLALAAAGCPEPPPPPLFPAAEWRVNQAPALPGGPGAVLPGTPQGPAPELPRAIGEWQPLAVTELLPDGVLQLANGQRVRLCGVRLPAAEEPSGREARDFLRLVAVGAAVQLEFDQLPESPRHELLAYVYLLLPRPGRGGVREVLLNASLLALGLARQEEAGPNRRYAEAFALVEEEARRARRGLWAER